MVKEITAQELDPESFINKKVEEIQRTVGEGRAINALSGGVDSSTVTLLGHRALGGRLKTVFIENGLEIVRHTLLQLGLPMQEITRYTDAVR